jgi:acetyl-CoA C-acetyltransferase
MGQHCEMMAKDWKITREEQDQLALESHQKAAAAYARGFYKDLVHPSPGLDRDNILRADTSLERLAKLKAAFDPSPAGTLTAGNSSALTDGASVVLLGSEAFVKERGLQRLAYLTEFQNAAVNIQQEGLLMAPTVAVGQMLKRAGLSLQDFDFYEIHEAFAAQVLCTLKAWESDDYCQKHLGQKALGSIDRTKLNVAGGSLALGHPFAATGARIVATAAKLLAEKGRGRCLISICTGGGMATTAILERP